MRCARRSPTSPPRRGLPSVCTCALTRLLLPAQAGKLPLHVAAANQASEAVVVALLEAHPEAATEKDQVLPA